MGFLDVIAPLLNAGTSQPLVNGPSDPALPSGLSNGGDMMGGNPGSFIPNDPTQVPASVGFGDAAIGFPGGPTDPNAPAASSSPSGSPSGPSLVDIINGILGPQTSGSDYFNSSPFDQARSQLGANQKNAQGLIDNAYKQASDAYAALRQQAGADAAKYQGQAQQNAQQAQTAQQGFLQASGASGAAPGSELASRLGMLNATLSGNQARGIDLANTLAGIQSHSLDQGASSIPLSHQGALDALARSIAGAQNRIGLSEANAQTTAAARANSANNSRAAEFARMMTSARGAMKDLMTTGRDQASQQLLGLQQSGDPTDAQAVQAFQQILYGGQNSSGQTIPGAHNAAELLARAQNLPSSIQQRVMPIVNSWYDNQKRLPSDWQQQILSMIGGA